MIEPFGTLWFIYLLPIFFVVTSLTARVPAPVIWLFGAALEIAHINTGWTVPDEFAARFVYCYTGYIAAGTSSRSPRARRASRCSRVAGLLAWGLVNGALVYFGYEQMPFVSLGLGLVGACAVVTVSALMARHDLSGRCAIAGAIRSSSISPSSCRWRRRAPCCVKTGMIADIGTVSVVVTVAGVIGALGYVLGGARNLGASCSSGRRGSGSRPKPAARQLALQPGGIELHSPQQRIASMRG